LFVGTYYAYASRYEIIQSMSSSLSHTTTHMQLPPLAAVAAFYFLMGLFSASLCVGVALRPSFFRAKGALTGLPYPVWSTNDDPIYMGANSNSVLSLIPVQSLLSFGERHLISNYKYIQVMIGGEDLLCFFRRVGTAEYDIYYQRERALAHLLVSQKFPMALMYGNPTMPSCAFTRIRV